MSTGQFVDLDCITCVMGDFWEGFFPKIVPGRYWYGKHSHKTFFLVLSLRMPSIR